MAVCDETGGGAVAEGGNGDFLSLHAS
jgi:hypothetical protein